MNTNSSVVVVRKGRASESRKQTNHTDPNLVLRPAFKGQVTQAVKIEGIPYLLTTSSIPYTSAHVYDVSAVNIEDFGIRFSNLYEEYRIIKAAVDVELFSSIRPGLATMWFDELNSATPTLAESKKRATRHYQRFNVSSVEEPHQMTFVPHSTIDQQWLPLSNLAILSTFKLYSSDTYGLDSTSAIGMVTCTFSVQFRGFK